MYGTKMAMLWRFNHWILIPSDQTIDQNPRKSNQDRSDSLHLLRFVLRLVWFSLFLFSSFPLWSENFSISWVWIWITELKLMLHFGIYFFVRLLFRVNSGDCFHMKKKLYTIWSFLSFHYFLVPQEPAVPAGSFSAC